MNSEKLKDTKLIYSDLHSNNELSEWEMRKIIPFMNCIKKNIVSRNKSTKEVKDPYSENYKALIKETKDYTNGKIYLAH